ncbi:hypothetical protein A9K55_008843 [Cordyceps militaris]|uniref:DUF4396 domain-containing protein n=1 Tax=Cordyceps militaris TaxID=73501 RepID=A0A2H4SFW9_CORMI|nr:hypothetical protein A9K55_008843 [Cordyceps militaris]
MLSISEPVSLLHHRLPPAILASGRHATNIISHKSHASPPGPCIGTVQRITDVDTRFPSACCIAPFWSRRAMNCHTASRLAGRALSAHRSLFPNYRSVPRVVTRQVAHTTARPDKCCAASDKSKLPQGEQQPVGFWASRTTWRRASVNTLRCLVGCTTGDFSAMWLLQTHCPELGMPTIMGLAMAAGISTSMVLETVLLRLGRDGLSWPAAAKTAAGMSLISMVTMELAENVVDYSLTGGAVAFDSPAFWLAALVSMGAGFLAPLPYNYHRLRKYGKACH